jgi:hypothetical protein
LFCSAVIGNCEIASSRANMAWKSLEYVLSPVKDCVAVEADGAGAEALLVLLAGMDDTLPILL